VRADREEGGVEAAVAHRLLDVRDRAVELELHAEVEDPLDLGVQDVARKPVARDPEAHHAARERPGLVDRHRVPAPPQVVGGRQAGGPGADHEDALADGGAVDGHGPAAPDRLVAEEALDRVDPHRLVELPAVAGGLARGVADAAHHGGQRVVLHDLAPGRLACRSP
jgi:hypothetical protein